MKKKVKVYTLDDVDIIWALSHFNETELDVISRFNEFLRKEIKSVETKRNKKSLGLK